MALTQQVVESIPKQVYQFADGDSGSVQAGRIEVHSFGRRGALGDDFWRAVLLEFKGEGECGDQFRRSRGIFVRRGGADGGGEDFDGLVILPLQGLVGVPDLAEGGARGETGVGELRLAIRGEEGGDGVLDGGDVVEVFSCPFEEFGGVVASGDAGVDGEALGVG